MAPAVTGRLGQLSAAGVLSRGAIDRGLQANFARKEDRALKTLDVFEEWVASPRPEQRGKSERDLLWTIWRQAPWEAADGDSRKPAEAAAPELSVEDLIASIVKDKTEGQAQAKVQTKVPLEPSASAGLTKNPKAAQKKNKARVVEVLDGMQVRELAAQLGMKTPALLSVLAKNADDLGLGPNITQDTRLDAESSATVVVELDHDFQILPGHALDLMPRPTPSDTSKLPPRPPVVTIMGHVDHGKTTLLDTLRNAAVAAGEAGGITQHIGAFTVKVKSGKQITFLDTPGHAAFSEMRHRGAAVTDVVVLVVAATDGVRPQTLESIKHARDSQVPMVVAVNKIDADNADPELTKASLDKAGVEIEENGGDTQCVEISALKGLNLDKLVEAISTAAELEGLWSDASGAAEGYILEARQVKGQGAVTTALVKRGTLKPGQVIVAGKSVCKVKAMRGPDGKPVKTAGPSHPVEISGWRSTPEVGDMLVGAPNEKRATEAIKFRETQEERDQQADLAKQMKKDRKVANKIRQEIVNQRKADLRLSGQARVGFRRRAYELRERAVAKSVDAIDDSTKPRLRFILKSDVVGSEEAIVASLQDLSRDDFEVTVIDAQIGAITDSDIEMAETFGASILCFNVNISKQTQDVMDGKGTEYRRFRVIYDLLDYVEEEIKQHAPKRFESVEVGVAVVQKIFTLSGAKKAVVAGCHVDSGMLARANTYEVVRGGKVVHSGPLNALKHHMDEVEQVTSGQECGLSFSNFTDLEEGDTIRCIEDVEV